MSRRRQGSRRDSAVRAKKGTPLHRHGRSRQRSPSGTAPRETGPISPLLVSRASSIVSASYSWRHEGKVGHASNTAGAQAFVTLRWNKNSEVPSSLHCSCPSGADSSVTVWWFGSIFIACEVDQQQTLLAPGKRTTAASVAGPPCCSSSAPFSGATRRTQNTPHVLFCRLLQGQQQRQPAATAARKRQG